MSPLRKILITGGAGFIGSAVARACLEAGYQVVIVDDLSRGRRENLPAGAQFFEADIRDLGALREIFQQQRPEIVSHHAAMVSVRESMVQPARYRQVNVLGTRNVLTVTAEVHARQLIFASSGGAVYGEAYKLPIHENAPCHPLSTYGETKLEAERFIAAAPFEGVKTILRYGNVYGPGQDPGSNNGVIAIFAHLLGEGRRPVFFGDGSQLRDYVHVEDVAGAHLRAMQACISGVFNIASGRGHTLAQVYHKIADDLGVNGLTPRYAPANSFEVRRNVLDIRRAEALLGWQPKIDFISGVAETLRSIHGETT